MPNLSGTPEFEWFGSGQRIGISGPVGFPDVGGGNGRFIGLPRPGTCGTDIAKATKRFD
jgi:hypothetical protein